MLKNLGMIFGTFIVLMVLYLLAKSMLGFDRNRSNPQVNKVETEFGTHEFAVDTTEQTEEESIPMH